ncbi:MAG TPA: matrixin family metalloprotease [Lacipirellulaceae bacterium]
MAALPPSTADAYFPDERWTVTASGTTGAVGMPITLTWSLVPDGTAIRNGGPSNLVNYFDDLFGSNTSGDLTQRAWFHVIEESFDRWSQLSGITFVYEPNDDGPRLQDFSGYLGVRGDVRIGGTFVDGPTGTLAYSSLPDGGDIVFDTGETNLLMDSAHNYRRFRNTLMHELGHAFGLLHIESSTDALLMEPFISSSIDGPQLDDIRGIQALYGDPFEKSHEGLGNDIFERATRLGSLPFGGGLEIGTDGVGGQSVDPTETDFVSIANRSDVDFYSFTTSAPALLNAFLKPLGGVFSQGLEEDTQSLFDANARSNLSLSVFADDGTTLLSFANAAGNGQVESISDLTLATAGTYYVRVTGASLNVQLYQLQLSAMALSFGCCGDYNHDGAIDAADYVLWRKNDGTQDGYNTWRANIGRTAGGGAMSKATAPEPATARLIVLGAAIGCWSTRSTRRARSKTRFA